MRSLAHWVAMAVVVLAGCRPGPGSKGGSAVDLDDDKYPDNVDCDDANADVFPGAVELCDGIDNNCDGRIDEDERREP